MISNTFVEQKLQYIHNNPVEARFVAKPEDYLCSSVIENAGEKGFVKVIILEQVDYKSPSQASGLQIRTSDEAFLLTAGQRLRNAKA